MTVSNPLLCLDEVSKSFVNVDVIKSISISFEAGTVTALVGDNGAGKSTLCKLISGVVQADRGSIKLNSKSLNGLSPASIRELGIEMVYQDLALAYKQDVVTNLYLGREIKSGILGILDRTSMRRQAKALLEEIGVSISDLSITVGSLSGGQRQAIAISRALLFSPKVLILDEPTAALAVKEIQQVLKLIKQLKSRGIVVILVSHRLNDVFEVSDRIVTLRSGQICADKATCQTDMQEVVSSILGADSDIVPLTQ